jgi:hypothetical protein
MLGNKNRKVIQIENGLELKIWNSITEATIELNLKSTTSICNAIKKGGKCRGFNWKYHKEEYEGEFWIQHPYLNIQCSSVGRVRLKTGVETFGSRRDKLRKYLRVIINGKHLFVHRLIAETFIENPENKPTVDHLDRNRENNNYWNLRWASMKDQNNNRVDNKIQFTNYSNRKLVFR